MRQVVTQEDFMLGQRIATAYADGYVTGWAGEYFARSEFYMLATHPDTQRFFSIMALPQQGKRMMLYECTRKVLNKDTENYPQEIGDCISFGAKNAIEHLICVQQVMGVAPSQFRPIYPPYLYGCGRVFIGHGRIPANQDGSVGAWQAQAVQKYGAIASDEQGVPHYSGDIAKQWGGSGPPKNFVEIGKHYPVKSAAQVNSYDDVATAVTNGYPVTVASNVGFQMEPDSKGFHNRGRKPWNHQMCIIGVDAEYSIPYGIVLNSWSDVLGHLKDFKTGESLPVGVLRVRAEIIDKMVGQGDSFAYSHLEWFQEQKLSETMFKLI